MRSSESDDGEEESGYSSLQHAKNSLIGLEPSSPSLDKMSDGDDSETAWNFNDLFEFAE